MQPTGEQPRAWPAHCCPAPRITLDGRGVWVVQCATPHTRPGRTAHGQRTRCSCSCRNGTPTPTTTAPADATQQPAARRPNGSEGVPVPSAARLLCLQALVIPVDLCLLPVVPHAPPDGHDEAKRAALGRHPVELALRPTR